MNKRWVIKPYDPKLQQEFSDALQIHPIIAQLLINRQITTVEQAERFLVADLSMLFNPFLLTDMDKTVEQDATSQVMDQQHQQTMQEAQHAHEQALAQMPPPAPAGAPASA